MRRQNRRGILEAIDEQAAEVVGRIIDRTHNLVPALPAEPVRRSVEQRTRNRLVVDRFEHSEATDIGLMERVIPRIVAGHDPADDLAVPPRQEKRRVAMFVKWMFGAIE